MASCGQCAGGLPALWGATLVRFSAVVDEAQALAEGFREPDFHAPLDVDAALSACSGVTVKGLLISDVAAEVTRAGKSLAEAQSWIPFKDYPIQELMRVEVEAAQLLHPSEPLRSALRQLAWTTYPNFVETMIGRAIFAVAGRDFGAAVRLSPRAYAATSNRGEVQVLNLEHGWARVQFTDQFNFVDCYQVGVFEGGMTAFGAEGKVLVRTGAPGQCTFDIRWHGADQKD